MSSISSNSSGSGTAEDLEEAGLYVGSGLGLSQGEGHGPAVRGALDPSYSLAWRVGCARTYGNTERAIVLASLLYARGSVMPGGSPGRELVAVPRPEVLDAAVCRGVLEDGGVLHCNEGGASASTVPLSCVAARGHKL